MNYNFDTVISRTNTNCYKWDWRKDLFGKEDILPMWVADMEFATPPFVLEAIQKRLNHPILGYTFRGKEFNESIVTWNKMQHDWDILPEWISFAPGVVPALNLLVLAFTKPGDKIVVQPPVYFPFYSAIANHKRKIVKNPLKLNGSCYEMDLEDLKSKLDNKVKMIFLCSPQNPGGIVWSSKTLSELAEICLEHNILIVSDEIHADLVFQDNKHVPTASLSKQISENTITCMAPSKTFNTAGLATSYTIISNKKLKEKYDQILDHVHVGAGNIFGDEALIAAYCDGKSWLLQLLHYLEENLHFLEHYFNKYIPGIQPMIPEATYMTWLDCSELNLDSKKLSKFFIEKAQLGLSPGTLFGKEGEGFMRLNFACPRVQLKEALDNIRTSVENLAL